MNPIDNYQDNSEDKIKGWKGPTQGRGRRNNDVASRRLTRTKSSGREEECRYEKGGAWFSGMAMSSKSKNVWMDSSPVISFFICSASDCVQHKLPIMTEILFLKEEKVQGGLFGIGMTISRNPPHSVLSVDDLKGPEGQNFNHMVEVGDRLHAVDDVEVEQTNIESCEQLIWGKPGSNIRLSMFRSEFQSSTPVEITITGMKTEVRALEDIRLTLEEGKEYLRLQSCKWSEFFDGIQLIIQSQRGRFRLVLSRSEAPLIQVASIIAGGPAFLSGRIQVGDELIAIDGNYFDGLNSDKLSLSQPIGAQCSFKFKRGNVTYDVALNRASASAVRAVERLFQVIETLEVQIRKGSPVQALISTLQSLAEQVVQIEKKRADNETWIFEKIRQMQQRTANGITVAETMLFPKKKNGDDAVQNAKISSTIEVLNSENVRMRQEIIELKQTIESLTIRLSEYEVSTLRSNEMNQKLTEEKSKLTTEIERLMSELEKISFEMTRAKALMKEKDDVEKLLIKSKTELEVEQQTISSERATFQYSIEGLQKQYEQSMEIIEKCQKESEYLRKQNNELSETIRTLKQELDPLRIKVNTEMVDRSEYVSCMNDCKALRNVVQEQEVTLQNSEKEMVSVREKMKSYMYEADKAKREAQDSLNEIHDIKRQLSAIGLSYSELDKVAVKLAGPPKVYMSEILDLLDMLSKSDRSFSEVQKIISIMNMEQAWSSDDLLRVRKILSGPPVMTLDALYDMILGNETEHMKTELHVLRKRVSEMEEIRKQKMQVESNMQEYVTQIDILSKENHRNSLESSQLQRQIDDLQRQNEELRKQLMQLDQLNNFNEQLKTQNENLKGEIYDTQLRIGHLDSELKRLREELEKKDLEIERLKNSKASEILVSTQHQPSPPMPPKLAGVGMLLESTSESGRIYIKYIVPGGPAALCGKIRISDQLLKGDLRAASEATDSFPVEDVNVYGLPLDKVFDLILGEEGTEVSLTIGQEHPFGVSLLKLSPDRGLIPVATGERPKFDADFVEDLQCSVKPHSQHLP
eukprot:746962-Hanusia_phi.AAC.2